MERMEESAQDHHQATSSSSKSRKRSICKKVEDKSRDNSAETMTVCQLAFSRHIARRTLFICGTTCENDLPELFCQQKLIKEICCPTSSNASKNKNSTRPAWQQS
ncbi:hypothetical protein B9Z55_022656 [Caenorhabditis nigoni]|uniref:Uncharacterized protein n=1 Tax=Caenorhabditis nigoni TaxID=1611254 RepID=A0A2G5SL93_9PELO|nr:hypothetical protein B9Z55_022656 [Caenorhabditis nigoni]